MVGKITPVYIPKPVGMLGWDGTDFHALKVDAAGNLVLGSKLESGDQLFAHKAGVYDFSHGVPSGANGYRMSTLVPASTIWVITAISAHDNTTANTRHLYQLVHAGTDQIIYELTAAIAIGRASSLQCELYLGPGDFIRAFFVGALANDACRLNILGYAMTKV